MTRSMTGFATKLVSLTRTDGSRASLSINIKSLNSRFFELTCRLPYQINHLETSLSKELKKILHRGHVYMTINLDNKNFFKGAIEPSLSVVKGYTTALDQIKKTCNLKGELALNDIINLPDIFITEEKSLDENTKNTIINAIIDLAHEVIATQEEEGMVLQTDILERIGIMEKEIQKISSASEKMMVKQKEKITLALQEIEDVDENKKAELQKHAAYALLDKMDIHEEIIRFNSHLGNLRTHLTSKKIEKGKRLDFTLQELAREINTIAAKCSDAAIGSMAIDIKVELEKAREQTQNIV